MQAFGNEKGFARLDFDDIKRVAALTGFDVYAHARTKKSCGPGCDYLVHDKRYYTLLLLKHIEQILRESSQELPRAVLDWFAAAQVAAREYAEIERTIFQLPSSSA